MTKNHLIHILVLFCILLLPITASAAPIDQQVSDSFNQLAKDHVEGYKSDPRAMIYFISGLESKNIKEGWRKSKCLVTEPYSSAIIKNDSEEDPYTAYLIYKMAILVSPPQPTKELAETTEEFKPNGSPTVIRITFTYQDEKWIPEKYEEQFQVLPTVPSTWITIGQDLTHVHFRRLVVRGIG